MRMSLFRSASRHLPALPPSVAAEPGRNVLVILAASIFVVSFGEHVLPVVVVYAAGFVGGRVASYLGQPALVGMLIGGCLVRNGLPPSAGLPGPVLSGLLRNMALALIMLRAGLGLEVGLAHFDPLERRQSLLHFDVSSQHWQTAVITKLFFLLSLLAPGQNRWMQCWPSRGSSRCWRAFLA